MYCVHSPLHRCRLQAHIFELKDSDGRIAPIVLKASRKVALISESEREWETGRRLSELANDDGEVLGFMKTGPAVRFKQSNGKMTGGWDGWHQAAASLTHPVLVQTTLS